MCKRSEQVTSISKKKQIQSFHENVFDNIYLRCKDFETCVNTDGDYNCVFDYNSKCPNQNNKYKPEWKGVRAKNSF